MDKAYQQASWQSLSNPLWYQKNTWAYSQKILLADALSRRQGLHKGMQYMFGFKKNPTEALWWLTILASSYPLLEKYIDRFCHKFANFDKLEGRQLWLNLCYRWPTHKDSLLQATQGHYQSLGPCWGHHQYGSDVSQSFRLNCHWIGVTLYLKIIIITMLLFKHQAKTLHCLLPVDKRLNWEAKYHDGSLSSSFYQHWAE